MRLTAATVTGDQFDYKLEKLAISAALPLEAARRSRLLITKPTVHHVRPRSESESERQRARNGASESEREFFPELSLIHI